MKKYMALWLLLAVALLAILAVAFTDDIKIGSVAVKKAPFADHLLAGTEVDTDSIADNREIADVEEKKIVTDSTSQSILIFGDSMTYNLALRLAQYARQNGHTLHSINWDSSNTKIWAESDTLKHYISEYKPTQIFIVLGSNELYYKNADSRRPYVEKILAMIDTIPYVWIGPPNWKPDTGVNDMIERTCKPRTFFRSAGMEFKRKKDKVHPTRESSADWMDSIVRWLPKSAHPFVADIPGDSIKKANPNIIFLKALNK